MSNILICKRTSLVVIDVVSSPLRNTSLQLLGIPQNSSGTPCLHNCPLGLALVRTLEQYHSFPVPPLDKTEQPRSHHNALNQP